MIVLAESNFVLELAFQQEQSDEVESIVAFAEAGRIELVIPACAFTEPANVESAAVPAPAVSQGTCRRSDSHEHRN